MKKRQDIMKILLVVLLGFWGIIFAYQFGTDRPTDQISPPPAMERTGPKKVMNQGGDSLSLRMDLLENSQKVQWTDPNNIFKPVKIYKPPPPPPPPPPVPEVYIPSPEELAAERARQELSQFRVLGFLNKGDRQEVFLSRGGELFIAQKGDLIQGRFRVKELEGSQVVLQDPGTFVEITIFLGNP